MASKALRSWKLSKSPDPFYPFGIRCIGSDTNYAISIWSAFRVDNLMFRNFQEAIKKDEPANKTYLHPSLEPDWIVDIAVGAQDTVILMKSGLLKYFKSPKKIDTVDYLQDIRAICSFHDGFVLLDTPNRGMDIFVEIHPDAFPRIDDEEDNRKRYDISFEKGPCQSTWRDSHFLIKELSFKKGECERFYRSLFQLDEDVELDVLYGIFFVIDQNFLLLHINSVDDSHFVHTVITCSTNICNFWVSKNESTIFLLLESGVIECLTFSADEGKIVSYQIFLESYSDIVAFDFCDDIFTYSDGVKVIHGMMRYNEESGKFKYHSRKENLAGVAALTILNEFDIVLCISDNHIFYIIPLQSHNGDLIGQTWVELDENIQNSLNQFKYDVIDLNEAYDNLNKQLTLQKEMAQAVVLRRSHDMAESSFVAKITFSKNIPERSSKPSAIYVSNSEVLDQSSYFVNILILPKEYLNEFNSHLWNVRFRWKNIVSGRKQMCVNIKVFKEALLKPLNVIIHLKQDPSTFRLPQFDIDVNAPVLIGQDYLYLSFPVKIEQESVQKIIEVYYEKPVFYQIRTTEVDVRKAMTDIVRKLDRNIELIERDIIYRIKLPSSVTFNGICTSLILKTKFVEKNIPTKSSAVNTMFIDLLGNILEFNFHEEKQEISLKSKNPGVMLHVKEMLFEIIFDALNSSGGMKNPYKISKKVLSEYFNTETELNNRCIFTGSEPTNINKQRDMLKCVDKARQSCAALNFE